MKIHMFKPIKGQYQDITQAPDQVFSEKLFGPGFIITPKDHHIYAPIDGTIKMIYPTYHAFAISNDEVDILIHIGLNETLRDPSYFDLKVSVGDKVSIKDLICTLNVDFEKLNLVDYMIPVVFVQKKSMSKISETASFIDLLINP